MTSWPIWACRSSSSGCTPRPPTASTPPPPPVTYKRPTSMGGVHISHGGRSGYHDWLVNCGRSVLVKSFMDFGALMEAKTVNPDTITVIRVLPAGIDEDTPAGNWQWDLSRTRKIARDWMSRCYQVLDQNDRKWYDYVEVMNEPDPADAPAMERANGFVQACMEDADLHGYKLAIWAWAAGLPRTPVLRPQISTRWNGRSNAQIRRRARARAGDPRRQRQRRAAADPAGGGGRNRAALSRHRENDGRKGWPMPPVVITEAYQESGYKKPNWTTGSGTGPRWPRTRTCSARHGSHWETGSFGGGQNVNIVGQLRKMAVAMSSCHKYRDRLFWPLPVV